MHRYLLLGLIVVLAGCSAKGVVVNTPHANAMKPTPSVPNTTVSRENNVAVLLAFSGGGNRAAALSYGVLKALHESRDAQGQILLDEVDAISAVSGGTFTAAYYGLVGDKIFSDYRQRFLLQDNETHLLDQLKSFAQVFGDRGRSELLIEHFDNTLFKGATMSALNRPDTPQIILNASDLGRGVRLSFTQPYFDLLCSNIDDFPISRAVASSAAVPLVFNPLVLRNYDNCGSTSPAWLSNAKQRLQDNSELALVIKGLESFADKQQRQYIHLVDGGITDNLGLRAIYETVELQGGIRTVQQAYGEQLPSTLLVITVDASTQVLPQMDNSADEPELLESVNAITDAQLHRYNAATLELFKHTLEDWAKQLSQDGRQVTPYFVSLGFDDLQDSTEREYFNAVPTSLSLTEQQVDKLIEVGQQLLRDNPQFKDFSSEYGFSPSR